MAIYSCDTFFFTTYGALHNELLRRGNDRINSGVSDYCLEGVILPICNYLSDGMCGFGPRIVEDGQFMPANSSCNDDGLDSIGYAVVGVPFKAHGSSTSGIYVRYGSGNDSSIKADDLYDKFHIQKGICIIRSSLI